MKKYMIIILAVSALLVSAFGGSYGEVVAAQSDTGDATPEAGDAPKDGERSISDQERFIIGVFELEDTDLVVTADQAASLVTLWTSMKDYINEPQMPEGTPDAAAEPAEMTEPEDNSEEVEALFTQIEAVMTADQLQAIADLELDQDAIIAFMEEQGIEMTGRGEGQELPDGAPAGGEGAAPEGDAPADGEGQGGPGAGADGEGGQPGGGGRGGSQVASSTLIDALITLLESKAS